MENLPGGSERPAAVLAELKRALNQLGISEYAVTGGLALGFWVRPRQTMDIDLVGVLPIASVDRLLALHDGMRVGPEPVPDIVRFRIGRWDVDFFASKSKYDLEALGRAVEVDLDGERIRVVTPEDLIIHKLIKLRADNRRLLQDAADLRALVTARGEQIDYGYLEGWLPSAEADAVRDIPKLADDELVRRLMGMRRE
jgi:hypothetical protein